MIPSSQYGKTYIEMPITRLICDIHKDNKIPKKY